ncbi:MAG TPA: T9SS type A sorting domain-containing protein [Flavobacteriales bacterium]|nr:T9SS type A sorting domain-containing protein [Flavobacteriales bacterium]
MNTYNQEANNSRMQATVNMLTLTGLPFDTTSFIDTAINYPVVVTASRITDSAFNAAQRIQLINYVSSGGVIITSSLRDTALFSLFGVDSSDSDNSLTTVFWDTAGIPQYFNLVNDSLEVVVSIGDSSQVNFFTRAYFLTTGQQMAHYEDGRTAVVMNNYGAGKTYLFGPDFRDVILRNQLNMDLEAQRVYSNGFEVSSDVFMFIVRNIIRNHIPNSVYSYTVPGNASSALLITHDVDSRSSIDTMHIFSTYENSLSISAHYNVTTRYMHDHWMSDYFPGNDVKFDSLLINGHVLASHSVGHFPDFADDSLFHFGSVGNTQASYNPAYFFGNTTGGSVIGELEVSKNILESTYGANVRSFRAGHLCFPDSLALGLQTVGYEYNSTQSANDVMTAFPHYLYQTRAFSSQPGPVLEIPMTISDVFKDDPIADTNHLLKVNIWISDIARYNANNAPVTLLIHPNRMFKLEALQHLLDSIPPNMAIVRFEDYGDFWRKRDSLHYHTVRSNDTLYVHMDNDKLSFEQSFVIDRANLDTVRFFDYNGVELTYQRQVYSSSQDLYYRVQTATNMPGTENNFTFNIYPNPTTGVISVLCEHIEPLTCITITDMTGRMVYSDEMEFGYKQLDLSQFAQSEGMYFMRVQGKKNWVTKKIILEKW